MKAPLVAVVLAISAFATDPAFAQGGKGALKKEVEQLRRENEELKRENERLKAELAALQGKAPKSGKSAAANRPTATVDGVEYVLQSIARNGAEMTVTLLATSTKGERPAPNGFMTIIDDEGEKFTGMPKHAVEARPVLREGVPLKLVWRFGPNFLTKEGSAPSPRTARFASVSVAASRGGGVAVEFRDVPATAGKAK